MMRTLLLLVAVTLVWIAIPVGHVSAECGTYFGYASDPCVDVHTDPINPYELCGMGVGIGTVCCSPGECPNIPPPVDTPTPGNSTSVCGQRQSDPGTGQQVCIGSDGKYVSPFVSCGSASPVCCRSDAHDQCPQYRCPGPSEEQTGSCIYDPDHGVYTQTYCINNDPCGTPPPAPTTPAPTVNPGSTTNPVISCPSGGEGINTAIGCIPLTFSLFFRTLFTTSLGIAGGIAFLLILIGALKILTSRGNPEVLTEGKETIIAAVSGLLLIVFSVYILILLGVDILGLPDFSGF